MNFSLVLPCFNEEENIASTVRSVITWFQQKGIDGEVIVVDDGSTDASAQILSDLEKEFHALRIINHDENQGYGCAVRFGLDVAEKDLVGFMDSDNQFRVEDFSLLLPMIGEVPFVAGFREHRADSLIRSFNAKAFNFLVRLILGIRVRDINCAMKVFQRSIWSDIRPKYASGGLFNAELFYRLKKNHVVWKQVPVSHYPREKGVQTGAKPSVIFRAVYELIRLRFGR